MAVVTPDEIARRLEQRLSRETGLVWHVGRVGLGTGPALELGNVTIDNPNGGVDPLASVGTVRVDAPWSVISGGAGVLHAQLDKVSASFPLSGFPPPRASGPDGARVGDITMTPHGLTYALPQGSDRLDAKADSVGLALVLSAGVVSSRTVRLVADGDGSLLTADIKQPDVTVAPFKADVAFTREPTGGAPGRRISATAGLTVDGSRVQLADVAGSMNGAPFDGSATIDVGAVSTATWTVRFASMALVDDMDGPNQKPSRTQMPTVRASDLRTLDLDWLDKVNLTGTIQLGEAFVGAAHATGVVAKVGSRNGTLDVAVGAERFYEGGARVRYVLTRDADKTPAHRVSLSIVNARAGALLNDLLAVHGIEGSMTVRLDAQAKGMVPDDILRSANGRGNLTIVNGMLRGLDLANTMGLNTGGLGGSAANLLSTSFSRMGASFVIMDGHASTDDLTLDAPSVATKGNGTVDLVGHALQFQLHPELVGGGSGGQGRGRLDIPVTISGPWQNPSVSADFGRALADPGAAIQTLQDVGGTIMKNRGDGTGGGGSGGLGGLLDSFLGGARGR